MELPVKPGLDTEEAFKTWYDFGVRHGQERWERKAWRYIDDVKSLHGSDSYHFLALRNLMLYMKRTDV